MERNENALKLAEFLLKVKAVELKPENPFTWASGLKSPIYCDNRKTLSFPQIRTFIRQQFVEVIESSFTRPDVIAGVATGGIAIGALVAQEMGLPFIYVRSEPKKHGLGNQIEGVLESGQKVVVIEDLISTGGSSLNAVEALRSSGAQVLGLVAIFTYGFEEAINRFSEAGCPVATLSNYDALIQQASNSGFVFQKHLDTLRAWKSNPKAWSDEFSMSHQTAG